MEFAGSARAFYYLEMVTLGYKKMTPTPSLGKRGPQKRSRYLGYIYKKAGVDLT